MQLQMPLDLATNYRSASQRARVVSEGWGERNLYCANCTSGSLTRSANNTKVEDFVCPRCASCFQLKSQSHSFLSRICDAAYEPMRRAIIEGRTPNLLALHYDASRWEVRNLILIPHFAFPLSSLEKRKPLGRMARRKGWVGCNILLANIPSDARIRLVVDGIPANSRDVRRQYTRLRPLARLSYDAKGWTLDVLNVVRALDKTEFSLAEVYARTDQLRRLHPDNRHVQEKIRQQLQRLRDMGLVEFVSPGRYRVA